VWKRSKKGGLGLVPQIIDMRLVLQVLDMDLLPQVLDMDLLLRYWIWICYSGTGYGSATLGT